MSFREKLDILKCSPEGKSNPKIVDVLDAFADEIEKSKPAPVVVQTVTTKKKATAKKK